eukprot:TRINITY_DN5848_c0_g1_i2.p1 TRINITY_DN5848_c0_g1~~TRINITY_DN5848_c0_g1_i2.p1  ORF type:complete len:293 (+),score=56.23 TRINITY_DN5848_c0_g1_i2:80-958(+)
MGCVNAKEGGTESTKSKAKTAKEAIKAICDRRVLDGLMEKDSLNDELQKLEKKYQAHVGEDKWTSKKTQVSLRAFALDVSVQEKWGAKGEELVNMLFPDPVDDMMMKTTKIPEFDEAFAKASSPIETLIGMRKDLNLGTASLKEACAFGGTCKTVKAAVENLKKEAAAINIDTDVKPDGSLDIRAPTATGPISEALENLKTFSEKVANVMKELPSLSSQVQEAASATQAMPGNAQQAAKNAGLSFQETLSAVRNTAANAKSLGALPSVMTETTDQAQKSLKDVSDAAKVLAA